MKRLISAYFANTGLLFPYIHEQEFLDTYERFQASGFRTDVRRTWLGLLNMILAMATCTSCWEDSGSETHFEESDIFYRRAQELCQTQMFRGTTLEIGQCSPFGEKERKNPIDMSKLTCRSAISFAYEPVSSGYA
jgi:hypothetical protein